MGHCGTVRIWNLVMWSDEHRHYDSVEFLRERTNVIQGMRGAFGLCSVVGRDGRAMIQNRGGVE